MSFCHLLTPLKSIFSPKTLSWEILSPLSFRLIYTTSCCTYLPKQLTDTQKIQTKIILSLKPIYSSFLIGLKKINLFNLPVDFSSLQLIQPSIQTSGGLSFLTSTSVSHRHFKSKLMFELIQAPVIYQLVYCCSLHTYLPYSNLLSLKSNFHTSDRRVHIKQNSDHPSTPLITVIKIQAT